MSVSKNQAVYMITPALKLVVTWGTIGITNQSTYYDISLQTTIGLPGGPPPQELHLVRKSQLHVSEDRVERMVRLAANRLLADIRGHHRGGASIELEPRMWYGDGEHIVEPVQYEDSGIELRVIKTRDGAELQAADMWGNAYVLNLGCVFGESVAVGPLISEAIDRPMQGLIEWMALQDDGADERAIIKAIFGQNAYLVLELIYQSKRVAPPTEEWHEYEVQVAMEALYSAKFPARSRAEAIKSAMKDLYEDAQWEQVKNTECLPDKDSYRVVKIDGKEV